eukprot:scaffold320368_cov13-Tisochrysis_lutea.AAC.1
MQLCILHCHHPGNKGWFAAPLHPDHPRPTLYAHGIYILHMHTGPPFCSIATGGWQLTGIELRISVIH